MNKYFFVALCTAACFFAAGCDNFLNGQNLKEKVEFEIDLVNAPETTITYYSNCGTVSHDNQSNILKQGLGDHVYFNESELWQFVEWTVYDSNTRTELTDQKNIEFADRTSMETVFTLKQVPSDGISLQIQPKCVKRPKIVTVTPLYDNEGVYRDRKITIMFDQKIDEDTIYYSSDEQEEVEKEYGTENVNWLGDDNKRYGYLIDGDENSIVYKCVSITKLGDSSVNYLKYYREPEFSDYSTAVLNISTGTDEATMPPKVSDILVTVKNTFGINAVTSGNSSKVVTMANEYSWNYFTNKKYDNQPPEFISVSVKMMNRNGAVVDLYTNNPTDSETTWNAFYNTKNTNLCNTYNINKENEKLLISAKIQDTGSGPASITAEFFKVKTNIYGKSLDTKPVRVEKLNYTASITCIGSTAETDNEYTLGTASGDLFELKLDDESIDDESVYKMVLKATDKNGKSIPYGKSFYFFKDHSTCKPGELKGSRDSADKEKLTWTNVASDYSGVTVYRYKVDSDSWKDGQQINSSGNVTTTDSKLTGISSITVNNLTDQTRYGYKVTSWDYCGNSSYDEYVDMTPPDVVTITNIETFSKDSASLKLEGGSKDLSKINLKTSENSATSFAKGETKTVTDLGTDSRNHKVTIQAYDYAGNVSTFEKTVTCSPEVGMIYYSDGYWSKENISGKTPLGVMFKVNGGEARIWGLTEESGYVWGNDDNPCGYEEVEGKLYCDSRASDGYAYYTDVILNSYKKLTTGQITIFLNYKSDGVSGTFYPIWKKIGDLNNSNSNVTWYVPGPLEFVTVAENYDAVNSAYSKLGSDYTLLSSGEYYWTCLPRRFNTYAHTVCINRQGYQMDKSLYTGSGTIESIWGISSNNTKAFVKSYPKEREDSSESNKKYILLHAAGKVELE